MFKLEHFIVYLFIAWNLGGSRAESTESTRSMCLLQDPPNQCGEFCLLVLQPLLDHIVKHQELWNTSEALRLNDTQAKLDRIQAQLAAQTLSLEDSTQKVPRDIKERMDRMENLQTTLQESLKKMPVELDERLARMEGQQKSIVAQLENHQKSFGDQLENQQKSIGDQLENHINLTKGHQAEMETLKNAVPINFEMRLTQIEAQQKIFQETLKNIPEDFQQRLARMQQRQEKELTKMETAIQDTLSRIPEDFKQRLAAMEQHQKDELTKMETKQTAIQDTLSKIYTKVFWPQFERIGSRLFYINRKDAYDWNSAVQYCRDMGGYIATIKDQMELDAISARLGDKSFWLGINDRASIHNYVSMASGKKIVFLKWNKGEPNHANSDERCVELVRNKMNDDPCSKKKNVICQSDNEV
ncbi:low affinity immunoglobulin epsilon Fc receptor [Drosophila erecta]|uniref:low affinity immunoglobulin epsilon Fc receptor n=1 Tax=Drosophila erecta TaxID=7220 RepID=UPI000F04F82B|nr:low affinity immunoglobulin epsilon Fc receptor [Drosophila erecta]